MITHSWVSHFPKSLTSDPSLETSLGSDVAILMGCLEGGPRMDLLREWHDERRRGRWRRQRTRSDTHPKMACLRVLCHPHHNKVCAPSGNSDSTIQLFLKYASHVALLSLLDRVAATCVVFTSPQLVCVMFLNLLVTPTLVVLLALSS